MIQVGSDAAKENLKKDFGLEGSGALLDGAAFSSDKCIFKREMGMIQPKFLFWAFCESRMSA